WNTSWLSNFSLESRNTPVFRDPCSSWVISIIGNCFRSPLSDISLSLRKIFHQGGGTFGGICECIVYSKRLRQKPYKQKERHCCRSFPCTLINPEPIFW